MSNYIIEDQVLASSQPLRLRGSIGKTNIENTNTINSRRLEDVNVEYWRQRAGWADDDETMKSYNQGVYNTYHYGNDSSSNTGGSIGTAPKTKKFSLDHMGWILGFASTFIFLIMLVKCCSSAPTKKSKKSSSSSKRKGSKDKSKDKEEGRSRSRSRSRTRTSRGRSKSKSRSKKEEASSDYKLMSDDDTKSTKSTRSRSRSRSKSGRRSRGRSKTKTRTSVSNGTDDKTTKKESVDPEQKMLV